MSFPHCRPIASCPAGKTGWAHNYCTEYILGVPSFFFSNVANTLTASSSVAASRGEEEEGYGLPGPPSQVMVTCGHASHWIGILLITPSSFVPWEKVCIHTTAHHSYDGGAELGEWWIPRYLTTYVRKGKGCVLNAGCRFLVPLEPVRRVAVPYLHDSRRRGA